MQGFFSAEYKTPSWLKTKLSRRNMLKSAAGATAIIAAKHTVVSAQTLNAFEREMASKTWQTLDAVLMHLLPKSATGPSANEIQATLYLYNLVHQQPTAQDEIDFIFKGVGWLNGYTEKNLGKLFIELDQLDKENTLRAISRSRAGENWLSMLISNIFEAMLAPPSYGGNPEGIGWKWLSHQAGFPLPPEGKRYYELPKRSKIQGERIAINYVETRHSSAPKLKKVTKA